MPTQGPLPPSPKAFGYLPGQNLDIGQNGPGSVQVFGHSYMDPQSGVGIANLPTDGNGAYYNLDQSFFRQTLAALGLQENKAVNYARSTARATADNSSDNGNAFTIGWGGWVTVLQSLSPTNIRQGVAVKVPFTASSGLIIDMYGINDINAFVGKSWEQQYKVAYQHSARVRFSRYRAAAVYEETDATNAFSGGGLGGAHWSTVADTLRNSGAGYAHTTTVGATDTITVNASYDGGPIGLGFIGRPGQTGADFTVTVDGVLHGKGSTNNITQPASGIAADGTGLTQGIVYRIIGLEKNRAHTIVITCTAVGTSGGALDYDYWQIEGFEGNPIIAVNTCKLRVTSVPDAKIDEWNQALYDVMAEFSSPIEFANLDAVIGLYKGAPDNYKICFDNIHLSELGARYGASSILDAYIRMAQDASLTLTTTPQKDTLGTGFYLPHAPTTAGFYVYSSGLAPGANTAMGLNTLQALPVVFTRPCTIKNLVIDQVTAGGTGSFRAGIYWDRGNGTTFSGTLLGPMNLLVDWGTLAWNATGITKVYPVTTRILIPGLYWLAIANLAAAATTTTLTGSHPAVNSVSSGATVRPLSSAAYAYTATIGTPFSTALPATISPTGYAQSSIEKAIFAALDIGSVP